MVIEIKKNDVGESDTQSPLSHMTQGQEGATKGRAMVTDHMGVMDRSPEFVVKEGVLR